MHVNQLQSFEILPAPPYLQNRLGYERMHLGIASFYKLLDVCALHLGPPRAKHRT